MKYNLMVVSIVACLGSGMSRAQSRAPYYPITRFENDTNYSVSETHYRHGLAEIQVAQAKRRRHHGWQEPLCSAWIYITKPNRSIDSIVFPNIDGMGGAAGLFVPKNRFSDSLFAIVKLGDYDGRLILIDLNGKVTQFPGGAFLIVGGGKYLFSISESDCQGIDVIDLIDLKSVYKLDCLPASPDHWYRNGQDYLFVSIDKPDSAYFYRGSERGFVAEPFDQTLKSTSTSIEYDFNP